MQQAARRIVGRTGQRGGDLELSPGGCIGERTSRQDGNRDALAGIYTAIGIRIMQKLYACAGKSFDADETGSR